MKQYTVLNAYTDNYCIVTVNGDEVNYDIVACYEVDGYLRALRSQGFQEAHFLPMAKSKYEDIRRQLDLAKEEYEEAKHNPLLISDKEAAKIPALAKYMQEN